MRDANLVRWILPLVAGVGLTACGGGGPRLAGIDGTGSPRVTAVGAVTGFGSVVVNGVRYDTSNATFDIDGQSGTQADLAVGHVVLIRGMIDDDGVNGSANSVFFDDNVEGPISAVDRAAATFVVLGQLVRVGAGTSFDGSIQPASLDGLDVGDTVEVSGFVDAMGVVEATRIELRPAGGELEITAIVSSLNLGNSTFSLNALVVDFSSAMLADFPAGTVSEGDLVEVKGDGLGAMGELVATRVEFKGDDIGGDVDDRLEIEGFITRFVSATDFDVSGFPITTNAQTAFEGGTAADLGLNVKIEAEGTLNAGGILEASKIDIRRASAVRITAFVDSVDPVTDSVVTLGITVKVDALTRIEDKSNQDLRPFGVDQLSAGDYVEVRATELPAGSGELLASRLEREDPDQETILQGFITSFAQPTITILGVTIQTDDRTVFRDVDDTVLSAEEFFARIEEGSLVEADGIEVADQVIAAEEVELED